MSFKQLMLFLLAAAVLGVGCASGSQSTSGDEEDVSASPPSADEDTSGELPEGPGVEMGRSRAGASRDEAQQDEPRREDGGREDGARDAEVDDADAEPVGQQVVTRSQLDSFVDMGPSFALTQVEVEPSREDGTFQGFELVAMRPSAKQAVDGQLRLGDVITHINGVRMEKPDDYLDAWKLLAEVSSIRVDFIRDGELQYALWRVE